MSRRAIAVLAAAAVAAAALLGSVLAQGQSSKSSKVLFAVMTGKKEVGAGDSNGRGSFTGIVAGGQLCFGLTVRDISDPVAAHIHKGGSNKNGPVLIPLEHPSSSPGASSGCVDVKSKDAAAILKNPNKYYANVHTGDFPGGAIRGQLFAKSN